MLLTIFLFAPMAPCQEAKYIENLYPILSPVYKVPGSTDERWTHLNFKFGWTDKAPFRIAVQISNPSYRDQKINFAVKDLTTNQSVLLDEDHNVYFINETLPANLDGSLWSGEVRNLTDAFALKVWDSEGDSYLQTPVTISGDWAKKPRPIRKHPIPRPTPTPTAPVIRAVQSAPGPGGTPVNTPTPTATSTVTGTDTPTPCQTPAPYLKCALVFLGDSYTGQNNPSNPLQNYFCNLTYRGLTKWYPGVESSLQDVVQWVGCTPECWAAIPTNGWIF